jgi:hypothetical protein
MAKDGRRCSARAAPHSHFRKIGNDLCGRNADFPRHRVTGARHLRMFISGFAGTPAETIAKN